ncbi:MAG: AAA family ATPase [Candidatus Lokiarchaeota archaeon]|nr:AAA family ATPase [Candidatus Lokiarchaeota archaeon]
MSNSEKFIEKILFGNSFFKNEETLLNNYVPEQLPQREEEIVELANSFKPIMNFNNNFGVNIVITGPPGVGKTALVKNFGKIIEKVSRKNNHPILFKYYNCYSFRSKNSILMNLLNRFGIFSRGFGDEQLLTLLKKRLKKEDTRLILVLDEANLLGSKEVLEFIHGITDYEKGESRISLIVISRYTEYISILHDHINEYITKRIKLDGYSKTDLIKILKYRIDLAFYPNIINDKIIKMIANIASSTKNARHAINILYNAGKLAEQQNESEITAELIRYAKNNVYPEIKPEILDDLNNDYLFILQAIARTLKLDSNKTATNFLELYDYYRIICEEYTLLIQSDITPKKEEILINQIMDIMQLNLIDVISENIKQHKYLIQNPTKLIITLNDIPAEILDSRITKILGKRLKIEDDE